MGLRNEEELGKASRSEDPRPEEGSLPSFADEEGEALMARWGNALGGWRKQKRNGKGQFTGPGLHKAARARGGGFVPYARHGLGHNTVGVNAGVSITKNRRISAGFYVRTDTKSGQKKAAQIAKAQEHAQLIASKRIPDVVAQTSGGKLKAVKKAQAKALRAMVGGERKAAGNGVLGTSYHRVGTDRNSLPTYVVRYNSPKDRAKGSKAKRNKAIVSYNAHSVTGKRTYDWTQKTKKARPQRRKKNAR